MPHFPRGLLVALISLFLLSACQSVDSPESESSHAKATHQGQQIKINQIGFYPAAKKVAVVPSSDADEFALVSEADGAVIYRGNLSAADSWEHSGEVVKLADFSYFRTPGKYRVRVGGMVDSPAFVVGTDVYRSLNDGAIKAYYFNRASSALLETHAGRFARPMGHPDTKVEVHRSAASTARPEGTIISSPKGWYDAGDYNKYIVNSGISTYTLMAAYEHFPAYYQGRDLNIPESGDEVPDLLDEVMWNLDWMLTMQDPNDGGVYHKLTTKNFEGKVMPHEAVAQRYVVQKGTAAALNFAATMATASRVYAEYDEAFPGFSKRALEAAEAAWRWALANPDLHYKNPSDIGTGEYGDGNVADEFAWAAAELYITTGDDSYYRAFEAPYVENAVPSWSQSRGLAWMSLAFHRDDLTPIADQKLIAERVKQLASELRADWRASAYRVPMRAGDFVWGSNGVAMNNAMMLLQGYMLNGEPEYLEAAQSLLDYVLGRNPTGFSYVTAHGQKTPMNIHHRPSAADGIVDPVPGFLAGGPHSGQQDAEDCPVPYPSDLPAKSYLDHWCSYASNEITINWNAPLVYVSGAIDALRQAD